jgi:hypothetical protein
MLTIGDHKEERVYGHFEDSCQYMFTLIRGLTENVVLNLWWDNLLNGAIDFIDAIMMRSNPD